MKSGEDDAAALARQCRVELDVELIASLGVALVQLSAAVCFSTRIISDWRGTPCNAAPEAHSEIGWFGPEALGTLPLADRRHRPLLTELVRPTTRIEIRREDGDVWDHVGALHALSRQETYGALLPPSSEVRFRAVELIEHWKARAAHVPGLVLHVGWNAGHQLLGFAVTTQVTRHRYELNALHVRPDWYGRGLADWLHRAVVAHVAGQGGCELRLWVVEGNFRARRFYEKHGWQQTAGRRAVIMDSTTLPAVAYARDLERLAPIR